ncbi:MAG: hypothetical protein IGS03_16715 [Candidatus Sericytochromatia bacterium]|nr:hypothetical protein [Candidatus Sericytochromatia bacterium]
MKSKPFYQSKTIWLNVAVALVAGIEAATGALQPVFGDNGLYALIATSLPVANMILRGLTTQPLGKADTQPE